MPVRVERSLKYSKARESSRIVTDCLSRSTYGLGRAFEKSYSFLIVATSRRIPPVLLWSLFAPKSVESPRRAPDRCARLQEPGSASSIPVTRTDLHPPSARDRPARVRGHHRR